MSFGVQYDFYGFYTYLGAFMAFWLAEKEWEVDEEVEAGGGQVQGAEAGQGDEPGQHCHHVPASSGLSKV